MKSIKTLFACVAVMALGGTASAARLLEGSRTASIASRCDITVAGRRLDADLIGCPLGVVLERVAAATDMRVRYTSGRPEERTTLDLRSTILEQGLTQLLSNRGHVISTRVREGKVVVEVWVGSPTARASAQPPRETSAVWEGDSVTAPSPELPEEEALSAIELLLAEDRGLSEDGLRALLAEDPRPHVRAAALQSLDEIGALASDDLAGFALDDIDDALRHQAIALLGRRAGGDEGARAVLEQIGASDRVPFLRELAAEALRNDNPMLTIEAPLEPSPS